MNRKSLGFGSIVTLIFACGFLMPNLGIAEYPEKAVTFICPWPAGGSTDVTARTLTQAAKKSFPKPMVVLNRQGGAGTIGTAETIQSKPDGYTVGLSAGMALTLQPHRTKLPYGPPSDYTPIIRLIKLPLCVAVKKEAPWKSIKELIEYAKSNPGKVRIGHAGIGQTDYLVAELLKMKSGTDIALVPFPGSVENLSALLGGHIEAMSTYHGVVLPQVNAGKVRILGVFEEERNPRFPDAPTLRESGYDIAMNVYYLVIGPKDLAPQIVDMLHQTFKKAIEDPIFIQAMETNAYTVAYEGPKDLKDRLIRDYEQNAKLVDLFNLRQK
jgi:tripartite-type tricarboxylate transporter receptor subunit TctC